MALQGCPAIWRCLEAVRAAEPEAFLVYKPHPDVVAGLCRSGEGEQRAEQVCDCLLSGWVDPRPV